ncbi:hypothetical protein CBS101457_004344 [Exobasidium rhododendri]|nr:hypothetical protein CBS101457_004344 [Exobasidium rhododendri]
MAPKILDFECAIITGGAGGLGYAMAEYFTSLGKKVIIVGRTESKLQDASKKLKDSAWYTMDTGDVEAAKSKLQEILKDHPEVDCLINNAGVQRPLDVDSLDLDKVDNEIDINIRGPIHLATAILPHLKTKKVGVIMNVSSILGFVPYSFLTPSYNGSKFYMHAWTRVQRTVLAQTAPNVRVVEIVPPSVGTDLHRERENPDDNKKEKGATTSLTVEEFMTDLKSGLNADEDEISAGIGKDVLKQWQDTFGQRYDEAAAKYRR